MMPFGDLLKKYWRHLDLKHTLRMVHSRESSRAGIQELAPLESRKLQWQLAA
jgi:hypothetical protein